MKQLKWFDYSRDEEFGDERLERVEETIEYVANYVKQQGPFDGIFGFSQGGTLASLILQRQGKVLVLNCAALLKNRGRCEMTDTWC